MRSAGTKNVHIQNKLFAKIHYTGSGTGNHYVQIRKILSTWIFSASSRYKIFEGESSGRRYRMHAHYCTLGKEKMPSLPAEYVQNIARPYHLFYRWRRSSDVGFLINRAVDPHWSGSSIFQIADLDPVLNPEFWWLKIYSWKKLDIFFFF